MKNTEEETEDFTEECGRDRTGGTIKLHKKRKYHFFIT